MLKPECRKGGRKRCLPDIEGISWLTVTENSEIERYGLNAICTHLGCVVSPPPPLTQVAEVLEPGEQVSWLAAQVQLLFL